VGLLEEGREVTASYASASQGLFHIGFEISSLVDHQFGGLCVCERERVCVLERPQVGQAKANCKGRHEPLFRGSSGLGSKNKVISPNMTELRVNTGFQSALRIFKHTWPSQSIFG